MLIFCHRDRNNPHSTLTKWRWKMSMFGFRIHKCFMQQRARDSKIHIKSTTKRKNKKTNNRIDSFVLQNYWDAIIVLTQSIFDSHQMTVKNEHVWLQNSRMFYLNPATLMTHHLEILMIDWGESWLKNKNDLSAVLHKFSGSFTVSLAHSIDRFSSNND